MSDFLSTYSSFCEMAGCSPFFMVNATSSFIAGTLQRSFSARTSEEGEVFQQYLAEKDQNFRDKQFDVDLRNRRLTQERGRAFQIIESKRRLEDSRTLTEFAHFQSCCWPLKLDIASVWNLKNALNPHQDIPLTVILSPANTPAVDINSEYHNLGHALHEDAGVLGDIEVLISPWKSSVNNAGGVAMAMNIHYVMQGHPTLIITPQLMGETLLFDAAYWSFHKGLFQNHSILQLPYEKNGGAAAKEKLKTALTAIAGAVRDSHQALEFHKPPTLPRHFAKRLEKYPDIHKQIVQTQYGELYKTIASDAFADLSSPAERKEMQSALTRFLR